LASEPAVSPDGKKVAFMYREGPESHIYVLRSDGPEPVKLTTAGPNNWGPMWSPDGTQILFYSNRKGKGRDQIFLINADGSGERQLTNGSFNNIFPSWSTDGRRILFLSNREGQGKEGVFVMDADGSNPRRLDVGMRVSFARWSPDGKHLAFIAGEMPDTKIYIAAADGSSPRLLTR
jgi:TolB protein